MRKDKEYVLELRKSGKSYRQIQKETGVSLSTLSEWLKNEPWSTEIGKKLTFHHIEKSKTRILTLNAVRDATLGKIYDEGRHIAKKEYETLKQRRLFTAALVAYWGEGDRTSKHLTRLANSDPAMIVLFWRFLREICLIPQAKISCWLILYPDQDEVFLKNSWVAKTNIPLENFRKATYIQGRSPTKKNRYGVCSIVVPSRFFKEKMLVWLSLISKDSFQ
jgi:hypothetical protein